MRLLIALAALLAVGTACAHAEPAPQAVDGRIDLSAWDFDDGNVDLKGRWSVCWGRILPPGAPCPSGWATVGVRGIWSDDSAGSPFGGKGVATYRLRVALPGQGATELMLAAGVPMTAYRLWIDGEERGGAGVVGSDAGSTSSEPRRNRIFSLPRAADPGPREIELWVQLANFEFRGGGIRRPWLIGRPDAVLRTLGVRTVRDALLAAISVIIGLASLVQYALRRSDPSRAYFGLFALVMAVRMIPGSISDFTQIIVPWATFSQLLRFEYAGTAFAMVFGLGYIAAKFPDWTPPRPVAALQLISLAIVPIVAFAPLEIVIATLPFFLVMPPISIAFMIAVCARAWWRGASEVRVTLIASLVFAGAVIHDVIRASVTDFGSTVELFPYFFVVWLSAEAYELAERFARSFRREEDLAAELADLNFELQETESAVARFIPFDLLTLLGKDSIHDVEAGDQVRRVVSVLHCDLSAFRASLDDTGNEGVTARRNALLSQIAPAIRHNGGFIDEHRGPGLQAFFANGADAATRAALEVLHALRDGSGDHDRAGLGIATGKVLVGVLGEGDRLIGSAIGPPITESVEIAAHARRSHAKLLVSAATREAWKEPSRYATRAFDASDGGGAQDAQASEALGALFEVRPANGND